MKPFESQIRINKWQVDEAQRHLASLLRLVDRFNDDLRSLDEEMAAEQNTASASLEARYTYHAFLAQMALRRDTLLRSIAEVEGEIVQARDGLRDAFSELKKFEIAAAAAEERARRQRDQRQQQLQDEVALNLFRRQGSQR
jgi:flagellar FliJ protein